MPARSSANPGQRTACRSPLTLPTSPPRSRALLGTCLATLLCSAVWSRSLAAEHFVLRFNDLELSVTLEELRQWSENPASEQDLDIWFQLVAPGDRDSLARVLRRGIDLRQGVVPAWLDSWIGRQLVTQLGSFITTDAGPGGPALLAALRKGVEQGKASPVELAGLVPSLELRIDANALLKQAKLFRASLEQQKVLLRRVRELPLPARYVGEVPGETAPSANGVTALSLATPLPQRDLQLSLPHRQEPLDISLIVPDRAPTMHRHWVLITTGLGSSRSQLRWLADALALQGWPAMVLQHPGSDEAAITAALRGESGPPEADNLQLRLTDLSRVIARARAGQLLGAAELQGRDVVVVGHSLGAFSTALMAGATLRPGIEQRCHQALDSLVLFNSSQLLQCQLAPSLPPPLPPQEGVAAVVLLNSFGSLGWDVNGLSGMRLPLLSVAGSLDLITPPGPEQLRPFLETPHPHSRLALIDGASHFSPIRVAAEEEVLFGIGEALVGVDPPRIQHAISQLTTDFISGLEQNRPLAPQHLRVSGVNVRLIDRAQARTVI